MGVSWKLSVALHATLLDVSVDDNVWWMWLLVNVLAFPDFDGLELFTLTKVNGLLSGHYLN